MRYKVFIRSPNTLTSFLYLPGDIWYLCSKGLVWLESGSRHETFMELYMDIKSDASRILTTFERVVEDDVYVISYRYNKTVFLHPTHHTDTVGLIIIVPETSRYFNVINVLQCMRLTNTNFKGGSGLLLHPKCLKYPKNYTV